MDQVYYVLSVNGLLFLLSLIFYFYPPKKIGLYGYKTNRTILNEKIWDFANTFFTKQFLKYASISFAAALLLSVLMPISWQPMAIMVLSLVVAVIKTEQELNKYYDKEGEKLK